jgi:hypothetical protein
MSNKITLAMSQSNGTLPVKSEIHNFDISIFEVVDGKVNLTKLVQSQGKEIKEWLKNKSTKSFISALETARGNSPQVEIINGVGTFGTREVALKVAQWISSEFEVFCIEKIDTLFQTGKVELAKPENPIAIIEFALAELKAKELQIVALNTELSYKNDIILDIAEQVPAKTMRSVINQVIRNNSKDYQKNWTTLYKEYKYIYHKDLPILYQNAVDRCEFGKSKNILDYAEKFEHLTNLYKLAIKLFEVRPSYSRTLA